MQAFDTRQKRGKLHSIIILAEGVGDSAKLAEDIRSKVEMEIRVSILGYIQRGGNTTAFDRILASRLGARAVDLLIEGKSGRVVGLKDNRIIDMEIGEALSMKKHFQQDLYDLCYILSNNIVD